MAPLALSCQATSAQCSVLSRKSSVNAFKQAGVGCSRKAVCTTSARRAPVCAAASTEPKLENLNTDYCNDFECTSSPAVEQTVRAFSRDIVRLRTTASLLNKDVKYSDGFRSFQGSDKYARQRWYQETIQKPVVTITRMQMLDKGNAQIDWRIAGQLGAFQVDIGVATVIELNLLTGRVVSQKESWDLSKLSPPAAAFATANRVAWSAKQASQDTTEGINKKVSESLSSFDDNGNDQYMNRDPSDPTRFFQNNQDNQFQDALSLATILAFMYAVFRAFGELEKLS